MGFRGSWGLGVLGFRGLGFRGFSEYGGLQALRDHQIHLGCMTAEGQRGRLLRGNFVKLP